MPWNYGSYIDAVAVTPSDTVNFLHPAHALYVGGTGNVVMIVNGVAKTFAAVPAGTVIPLGKITRVNLTGTTATNMMALYRE